MLRLTGEQLIGETLLEHDLTAGGLLTGALMFNLQLLTSCLELTLQLLSLLGGEWLHETRLGGESQLLGGETRLPLRLWSRILLKRLPDLLEVKFLLLGLESLLLGDLQLDRVLRRGRRL